MIAHKALLIATRVDAESKLLDEYSKETAIPLESATLESSKPNNLSVINISVALAKQAVLKAFVRHRATKVSIIGAFLLGGICAGLGVALITTGFLAPLAFSVLGLGFTLTNLITVGVAGFTMGGLIGGFLGSKVDTLLNNPFLSFVHQKETGVELPEGRRLFSNAKMCKALGVEKQNGDTSASATPLLEQASLALTTTPEMDEAAPSSPVVSLTR